MGFGVGYGVGTGVGGLGVGLGVGLYVWFAITFLIKAPHFEPKSLSASVSGVGAGVGIFVGAGVGLTVGAGVGCCVGDMQSSAPGVGWWALVRRATARAGAVLLEQGVWPRLCSYRMERMGPVQQGVRLGKANAHAQASCAAQKWRQTVPCTTAESSLPRA